MYALSYPVDLTDNELKKMKEPSKQSKSQNKDSASKPKVRDF